MVLAKGVLRGKMPAPESARRDNLARIQPETRNLNRHPLYHDMTPLFHISRNFVEFGAFTALEVAAFRQRGVLGDQDYVRASDGQDWLPVSRWMAEVAPAALEGKSPAKPKSTSPRKRSATTAKAPKKAA